MAFKQVISSAAVAAMALGLGACSESPGEDGAGIPPIETAPPPVVQERQANFKALGKSFKAIRTQLEGDSPDFATIATAATDMNTAAAKIEGLFPEGTSVDDGFDTEALASIWGKPEEFAEAHKRLVDATAQMITLAESGDAAAVKDQVGAIGGSCKNCHDNFRLDTD